MNKKNKNDRTLLKENLYKLDTYQMKLFYGILVHAWASQRAFISKQNFFNLWRELNELCYELDEEFLDPYDDHEILKSFCHAHPYYFIDILEPELVINLFCEHMTDRIGILATIAQKLHTGGLRTAYEYSNAVLNLTDDIDESIAQVEEHVKMFS
jgi:hypothetical protein